MARKRRRTYPWASWPDERLLDLRLCDLHLAIGGQLAGRVEQIHRELAARGLRARPHAWLADEWYTPDGVPGIAIPFYLAHPRLMRLEHAMMGVVEGGTRAWCMRILRHETGHAIDNAFHLRRRRQRQRLFGRSTRPYPSLYRPRPENPRYVEHLDAWYAQSHPDEDFAETFAVWLTPRSGWRSHYADTPAMKKLVYVDALMTALAGRRPMVTRKTRVDPIASIETTLRAHYAEKRARYAVRYPDDYDAALRRAFAGTRPHAARAKATVFLRRARPQLRERLIARTGASSYTVEHILEDMIVRTRDLALPLGRPARQAARDALDIATSGVRQLRYAPLLVAV